MGARAGAAAALRRAAQSRTAIASSSLLLGCSLGAAYAGPAGVGQYAAAAPPPPSAMDRLRQRAGIKDGKDPWGQPLGTATRSRMAEVDVFALSMQPLPLLLPLDLVRLPCNQLGLLSACAGSCFGAGCTVAPSHVD